MTDPATDDLPQLRPELLEEITAGIDAAPSPDRRQMHWLKTALFLGCAAIAAAIFMAYGGLREGGAPRSMTLTLATTIGAVLIATWALWLAGKESVLDAPRRSALLAVLVATPIMLLTWKIAWSASFEGAMDEWPARVGVPCLQISLLSGAGVLLSLAWLRRRTELNHPALLGAAFGATAGAAAWVVTDLWCPVGHVPHLLVGHVLPLVLLVLAGTIIGSLWLGYRRVARRQAAARAPQK